MTYTHEELSTIAEIRDLQERYCRGIDRADADILRSVYWEDAQDEHGVFRGDREEYVAWVIPVVRERFAVLQHVLGQTHAEIDGDFAYAETYFVQHSLRPDGVTYASPGRYIDRLERRNGEWRILERQTLMSFFYATATADTEKQAAAGFPVGCMDREDASYVRGPLLQERAPVL
ncbi:nuclear transport factor 2 family protein [Salinibacterium sp. ZJ450]|uniref:nuclear transport factor 2 family protein n=1 Tax=Salinibacterium sp. ZJ450 TaxID=2708338 RepID=UPI00141DA976|nr:nuclear transport factor 2 family protein [Salinibacterium sp. ZJ450]